MRQSLVTRLALHAANLLVIAFLLLPLAAATIGALQSAKSLQASTRSVLPPEWTLDNFRVILSGGAQKGAIFEQATYPPDNVKKITTRSPTASSSQPPSPCSPWRSARYRPIPWRACGCAG